MLLDSKQKITPSTPEVKKEIEDICRNTMTKAEWVLSVLGDEEYHGQDGYESYYIAQWFMARFRYEMRWNARKHRDKLREL